MGGCSLALTMILYLTESLYFRSSTLTFYVIFPCVLNCKFIIYPSLFTIFFRATFFALARHATALGRSGASHFLPSPSALSFSFTCFYGPAALTIAANHRVYCLLFLLPFFSNHVDWPYLYSKTAATLGSTYR